MKKNCKSWIIGLGAAGSGILPSLFPLAQKSCTGSCGACGIICIPGVVLASWLFLRCFYKEAVRWGRTKSGKEAIRES